MFKFGRFKTSFNIYNEKRKKTPKEQIGCTLSINGAYRTNRDEFYVYTNHSEPQKRVTALAPKPAPSCNKQQVILRQSKSTSDLIKHQNLPPNLREAQSGISLDPKGADHENRNSRIAAVDAKKKKKLDAEKKVEKQRLEEQKKLEKQRLDEQKKIEKQQLEEQKKREKLALQERAKQDKLRKEREKVEVAKQAKKHKKTKKAAPQRPLANPLAQTSNPAANNAVAQASRTEYSTNTLESSISKTSGPPPYTEVSKDQRYNENSNVSFSKPVDTGSWDMISQHRNNVIMRTTNKALAPKVKVTTLDLNFTLGEENNKNNSDV